MRPARGLQSGLSMLCAITGCVQSDVVAVKKSTCSGAACTCNAFACGELDTTRDSFCAGSGFSSAAGDSCQSEATAVAAYHYALCTCTDYTSSGHLSIDGYSVMPEQRISGAGDVGINGDFRGSENDAIAGTLRAGGTVSSGSASADARIGAIESTVPPPCACEESALLDIAGTVAAREHENDNQASGLSATALDGVSGGTDLTLDCGRYYLTRIAASGALHLAVQGRVALFVAGNVELDGALEIAVAPGAELELFVAGNVRATGSLALGDPKRGQESLRLLIGGTGTIDLRGVSTIAGVVYAPHAELVTAQTLTVYGSLFVRRAAPEADIIVHYDTHLADPLVCAI